MDGSNLPDRRAFLERLAALTLVSPFRIGARESPSQPAPQRVDRVQADLPALMRRFGVPGISLAVVENGSLSRVQGFGVRKVGNAEPVTGDTIFEVASLSKPPFAYMTLKLAEQRQIDLDAGIGDFFRQPDFVSDPTVDAITPRIVLSHRTGLSNWRPAQQPMRFLFKPGTSFGYSGEAYVRLQRFVEKKLGTPLKALSETRLFTPWHLERSSYIWRAGYEQLAAEGHDANGHVVRTRLWGYTEGGPQAMRLPAGVEPPPLFAVPNAAASLYTTANDYGRFLQRLLTPPVADATHLSAASIEAMFSPVARVNDELSWGLGWGLGRAGDTDTFWHWGNNNVYQAFVLGSRQRRWGAVILTNSANGLKLCRELVARLLGTDHPAFHWNLVLPALREGWRARLESNQGPSA